MLARDRERREVLGALRRAPVVALLGPRQVGKTTLAQAVAEHFRGPKTTFDLERERDLARLEDAEHALAPLRGLVVLDEVQRRPELFPSLRVLADRPSSARFLVLGSAAPELLRQSSETLAGRILFHELGGFSAAEVEPGQLDRLWLRGGFPRSFLARGDAASLEWRENFIRTFVERDVPGLGFELSSQTLRRFWSMLAHSSAQVCSWSDLARALGVSDKTVRKYTDLLTSTFMVRQLSPWHENLSKRQVKAPKLYLRDSGLLHALLGIESLEALAGHPIRGASWEGFALDSVVRQLGVDERRCFFWATHQGAELDLLVMDGARRLGFEFKASSAPRVTRSMHIALQDLKLDSLDVIYPGDETYPLAAKVRAVGLARLTKDVEQL
jgi:uncharacterized protein